MAAATPEMEVGVKGKAMEREASSPGELQANGWERFIAGEVLCGGCGLCTWLTVTLLLAAITQGSGGFKFADRDDSGWDVLSDPLVQRYYAYTTITEQDNFFADDRRLAESAREGDFVEGGSLSWRAALEYLAPEARAPLARVDALAEEAAGGARRAAGPAEDGEVAGDGAEGRRLEDGHMSEVPFKEREAFGGVTIVIYEAQGTNCPGDDCDTKSKDLTEPATLENIKAFEEELYGYTEYREKYCMLKHSSTSSGSSCAPPMSLLQLFYFDVGGASAANTKSLLNAGFGTKAMTCLCQEAPTGTCDACASPASIATATACAATAAGGNTTLAALTVNSFCAGMNGSCNYLPPMTGTPCSSAAWSYPMHGSSALVSGNARQAWYDQMCSEGPRFSYWRSSTLPRFACEQLRQSGVPLLRSYMYFGAPADPSQGAFPRKFNDKKETSYMESNYGAAYLMKYTRADADLQKATDGKIRALVFSTVSFMFEVQALLIHDSVLAVLAFVLVFIYMWFTVESLFLTSMGMIQVLFSFPPAALVWSFINPNGIGSMQMLCIFMILGIGADDVFVFWDAWKQSRLEYQGKPPLVIFVAAYRRAFSAMSATTFTTGAAFLFGVFSKIPAVSEFCVFATIVVFFDFIWCITLLCSAVAFWERYMQNHLCLCFGAKAAPGRCCQPGCCFGFTRLVWRAVTRTPADATTDERAIERFISTTLFNFIKKYKLVLLGFWGALLVGGAVSAGVGLKTATSPPEFGDQDQMFVRFITMDRNYFASSQQSPEVQVIWGLDQAKPINKFIDKSTTEPNFAGDYAGAAVSREGQEKVLALCRSPDDRAGVRCETESCKVFGHVGPCPRDEAIWAQHRIYVPEDTMCRTGRYCTMELVKEYADREGIAFPVADFAATVTSAGFKEYLRLRDQLLVSKGMHWEVDLWKKKAGTHMTKDSEVGFMFMTFNATFAAVPPMDKANEIQEDWDEFVADLAGGTGAMQVSQMYLFMVLQNELLLAALLGIATSIAVALGALVLVTFNWCVAIIGFLNILFILVIFIGTVPLLGWDLGVFECIFLIMTVGLSVDYTVHLLHAYNECELESREERVRASLASMGITVLSGAATTLLAAIPLFLCWLRFFQQYGTFVFFTILFSILCAVLLLPPILLVVGPQGKFGDIGVLYLLSGKVRGLCGKRSQAPSGKQEGP